MGLTKSFLYVQFLETNAITIFGLLDGLRGNFLLVDGG
jgi:hypothetical protein